jgi:hypothetical protein
MDNSKANGLSKLGVVVSTAGLIAVIIWNQGTSHERQMTALQVRVEALEIQSRRGDMDHATHTAKFIEVETQFKWLREVMENQLAVHSETLSLRGQWILDHDVKIAQRDAEQWERIKAIERLVWKENP